ncbi:unnamed protein product, partial [Polarella glacialis]
YSNLLSTPGSPPQKPPQSQMQQQRPQPTPRQQPHAQPLESQLPSPRPSRPASPSQATPSIGHCGRPGVAAMPRGRSTECRPAAIGANSALLQALLGSGKKPPRDQSQGQQLQTEPVAAPTGPQLQHPQVLQPQLHTPRRKESGEQAKH